MKLYRIIAGVVLGLGLVSAAQAAPGRSTNDVNMRTGPSTKYHVVGVVPAGAGVHINGCLQGRTWCDVSYGNRRGWVSSRYLQSTGYRNGPRYVYNSGPEVILPFVAFEIFRGFDNNRRHYRHYRHYDRPRHYIGRGHGRDWRDHGYGRGHGRDWREHRGDRHRGDGGRINRGDRGDYRLREQTP